jgi:hypothetical protein
VAAAGPPPPPPCSDALLASEANTSNKLVDAGNRRIYVYNGTSGLNYAQAQQACEGMSYTGLPGRGYMVSYGRWVQCSAACCTGPGPGLACAASALPGCTWLLAQPRVCSALPTRA